MDKTILVVDDSPSVRTLVRLALERAGYGVIEACDGQDAIAKLLSIQPSLIVCDVNMPHMNGLALARELRSGVRHRFTPLLMLSTVVDPGKKSEAREAGVSAWIKKPFESRTLVDAVERLCL